MAVQPRPPAVKPGWGAYLRMAAPFAWAGLLQREATGIPLAHTAYVIAITLHVKHTRPQETLQAYLRLLWALRPGSWALSTWVLLHSAASPFQHLAIALAKSLLSCAGWPFARSEVRPLPAAGLPAGATAQMRSVLSCDALASSSFPPAPREGCSPIDGRTPGRKSIWYQHGLQTDRWVACRMVATQAASVAFLAVWWHKGGPEVGVNASERTQSVWPLRRHTLWKAPPGARSSSQMLLSTPPSASSSLDRHRMQASSGPRCASTSHYLVCQLITEGGGCQTWLGARTHQPGQPGTALSARECCSWTPQSRLCRSCQASWCSGERCSVLPLGALVLHALAAHSHTLTAPSPAVLASASPPSFDMCAANPVTGPWCPCTVQNPGALELEYHRADASSRANATCIADKGTLPP